MKIAIFIVVVAIIFVSAEGFSPRYVAAPRCRQSNSYLSMNMFNRFVRVVTSNVNSVISNLEDPEKVLDQAVNEMQSDLIKIRQSYAEVSATQKRMEKQKEQADGLANDWYRRAQLALEKGDEELAREALSRRQSQIDIAENIAKQLSVQIASIEKLFSSMQQLEAKILDAKREKDIMIARARTAKTSVQVNDMLSSIGSGTSSMDAFDRMKAKVENLEAKAEIAGELSAGSSGSSIEEKFKALDSGSKVNDELEMMRRQLGSGKKEEPAQLPEKAAAPPLSELDIEYERLKKELGR